MELSFMGNTYTQSNERPNRETLYTADVHGQYLLSAYCRDKEKQQLPHLSRS